MVKFDLSQVFVGLGEVVVAMSQSQVVELRQVGVELRQEVHVVKHAWSW